LANWFGTADTNHDGVLTVDEMKVDAERFFAKIDTDHNGEVDPDELAAYEWDIAPDIQVSSRTRNPPGVATPQKPAEGDQRRSGRGRWRPGAGDDDATLLGIGEGLQGAARYGLLNMPEPVAAADTNFDRVVTLSEFRQAAIDRFNMLDRSRSGSLTLAQLQAMRPPPPKVGRRSRPDFNAGDKRVGNPLPPGD